MDNIDPDLKLAAAALPLYGLAGAKIELLPRRGTTLFRVFAPDGENYVLRLYGQVAPSAAYVQSELIWLAALRRDADLVVPEPVPNAAGDLLSALAVEGEENARMFVLFRWVEGQFYDPAELAPPLLHQVGGLMAALHNHAASFVPPPGFSRLRFDWTLFFAPGAAFFRERHAALISPSDRAIFVAAGERVAAEMAQMGRRPELYSLIHGDLQHTNYLFHNDQVRAIDFGDCAWGYHPFDMVITLFDLDRQPGEKALRDAFFNGYSAVRALPPDYEALLLPFTAMRLAKRTSYLLGGVDAAQSGLTAAWIARSVRWLRGYLATRGR